MYRDFDNFEERTFKVKKKKKRKRTAGNVVTRGDTRYMAIDFKGSVYIYMYIYSICTVYSRALA